MGLDPLTFISGGAWPSTFHFRILLKEVLATISIGTLLK